MASLTSNLLTLNTNVVTSQGNLDEIRQLLQRERIDIAFLQEVAVPSFDFYGYSESVNLGPNKRGTALLWRSELRLTDLVALPSGRAIAASFGEVRVVCVYAPSGTNKQGERHAFFAEELAALFAGGATKVVIGGDFNSVQEAKDTTGHFKACGALDSMVRGLSLCDTWRTLTSDPGFTYHTTGCHSRLDRIYVSSTYRPHVKSVHKHAVSFGSHQGMSAHVNLHVAYLPRGPSYWKAARYTFMDERFVPQLTDEWQEWVRHQRRYPDIAEWWDRYGKPRIQGFCRRFYREYWKEKSSMKEHYRQCLEELYAKPDLTAEDMEEARALKEQLHQLQRTDLLRAQEVNKAAMPCSGEEPSMHTIIAVKKKSDSSIISTVRGADGAVLSTQPDISAAFVSEYRSTFAAPQHPLNTESYILKNIQPTLTDADRQCLSAPITKEELKRAMRKGPKNKSPGPDGLPAEFYQVTWDLIGDTMLQIFNTQLQRGSICPSQLGGVMVLLPKVAKPSTVKDYRPLTMLNADYKMLARVITARITGVAHKVLHPMVVQPGGARNITASLGDLRDAVSYFDFTQKPACLLSADIVGAFNFVRHDFLYEVMRRMGFGEDFIAIMKALYTGGTTRVQVNGYLSVAFQVLRSMRQGCPASAIVFSIVISPLIVALSSRITGLTVGDIKFRASAYADDVYALLTRDEDAHAVQDVFTDYEEVSGLAVSERKTHVIALGTWIPGEHPMSYQYVTHCRILGIIFASDIKTMAEKTWDIVVNAANGVLNANWFRALNLVQKVWFVSTYVLSKLWYVAQVLPIPEDAAVRLQRLINKWLWAGSTFTVPFRLLCAPRTAGGLGLLHPLWKALSLFMGRWAAAPLLLRHTFSAAWLDVLATHWPPQDAAVRSSIPDSLLHYKRYHCHRPAAALDLQPPVCARAVHRALYDQLMAANPAAPPRAERLATRTVEWPLVWRSISRSWHGSATVSWWYIAVHDLVRTRYREHHHIDSNKVVRTPPTCMACGRVDTLLHRLTQCGAAADVWSWLNRVLGRLPQDIFIRPDRQWTPKKLHATMSWVLGKAVRYMLEGRHGQRSLQDFKVFLRQATHQLDETDQRRFGVYMARITSALSAPPL